MNGWVLGRWTTGQWVLRALVLVSAQVATWLTATLGVQPRAFLVVLVAGLAVYAAVSPEGPGGTTVMLVVVAWWGLALREGIHPVAIGAAFALLVTHVCLVVAAYGPGTLPVDRSLVLLWVRRGLLVLVPVPLVYLVAVAVEGQPAPPGIWAAGALAAVVAGVGTSILYLRGVTLDEMATVVQKRPM